MQPGTGAGSDARPVAGGPRSLVAADLADCVALSASAHWNQTVDDWRLMLASGRGWGIDAAADATARRLVASVVVLPYGRFAWISMVLVLPAYRGRGFATTLLRHAIAWLKTRRLTPVLDATPAGFPIYRQLGFVPTWGFRRYRRDAAPATAARERSAAAGHAPGPRVRPLADRDWPAVLAREAQDFGADRDALLRSLATRLPRSAFVLDDGGVIGHVLGRDGREAVQIGPLSAPGGAGALALLDAALAGIDGPAYVDLVDRHADLVDPLFERGFVLQRPFTRMMLVDDAAATPAGAPVEPGHTVLVAGPELG